jgi:hypothetical protein
MSIGGIVSRQIRMPRYVVPQTIQTVSQARYASRFCRGVGTLIGRPAGEAGRKSDV